MRSLTAASISCIQDARGGRIIVCAGVTARGASGLERQGAGAAGNLAGDDVAARQAGEVEVRCVAGEIGQPHAARLPGAQQPLESAGERSALELGMERE